MSFLDSLILGTVQGITEFLPVSSSGHLVIFQHFLRTATPPVLFDVILHLGSLFAILVFFWPRLKRITIDDLVVVGIATLPTIFVGIIIEPYLEYMFTSLPLVAMGLVITSMFLISSRRRMGIDDKKSSPPKNRQALLIGLSQALAVVPGISRSGATVSTGLWVKLSKPDAFYYSFLLSIPAIIGAVTLHLKDFSEVTDKFKAEYGVGFIASFCTSLVALRLLKIVIANDKLHYFAFYCISLALGIVGYLLLFP